MKLIDILKELFEEDGSTIKCKCGWEWDLSKGGDEPYICHKCGQDTRKQVVGEAKPKAEKTKTGYKVPGKYLTKDKKDMKDEIERVRKLKSDDPSAYGKWKADYADKAKKKKYKTKVSAATKAYQKKFGK